MEKKQVSAYLEGREDAGGAVFLSDLRSLADNLSTCLKESEKAVTDESPRLKYRIARLESGSIALAVGCDSNNGESLAADQTIDLFSSTVRALQEGTSVDPRIGYTAIESFRKLADTCLRRSGGFRLSDISITTEFIAHADILLSEAVSSEGSIKGMVERLNLHNKNEFALYPPTTDQGITCTFDSKLFKLVHQSVKQNVTVFGTLYFHGSDPHPIKVTVNDIEIHPGDDDLPTLGSLRGLISDSSTNGLSAVDFPRMIRDE